MASLHAQCATGLMFVRILEETEFDERNGRVMNRSLVEYNLDRGSSAKVPTDSPGALINVLANWARRRGFRMPPLGSGKTNRSDSITQLDTAHLSYSG